MYIVQPQFATLSSGYLDEPHILQAVQGYRVLGYKIYLIPKLYRGTTSLTYTKKMKLSLSNGDKFAENWRIETQVQQPVTKTVQEDMKCHPGIEDQSRDWQQNCPARRQQQNPM